MAVTCTQLAVDGSAMSPEEAVAEQARLADAAMQSLFEYALFEAAGPARAARPEEAADPAPRWPGVYLCDAYSTDPRVSQ